MPRDQVSENELATRAYDALPHRPVPASDAVSLLATPDHLRRWLLSLPPNAIVADDLLSPTACLGCYFLRAHGFKQPSFGGDYFRTAVKNGEREPLPDWFRAAVRAGRLITNREEVPISAAMALTALELATTASKATTEA